MRHTRTQGRKRPAGVGASAKARFASGGRTTLAHADTSDPENEAVSKSERRAQLRFALTFIVVAGVLFSLYSFPYRPDGTAERWFHKYLAAYAHLAGAVLSVFDRAVRVNGTVIDGRFSLNIVKSCDAMEANLLFVAAIFAWPARWRRKLTAAVLGVIALVGVNVIRICTLYAIGVHFPTAFEFFHIEFWPLLIIAVAMAEFVGFTVWMRSSPGVANPPQVL